MKLTPEQQNALCGGVGKDWNEILVRDVNAFLAGCRYQHQITVERAAKVCEAQRAPMHQRHLVAVIRDLPYDDK